MKKSIFFLTVMFVISACAEPADAQPSLTVKYLEGGWVSPDEDCNGEYGPGFQYTANGEVAFEDGPEPYEIRGNRIYFITPADFSETYDEIVPIDRDTMRLRQQNSEWVVLRRCEASTDGAGYQGETMDATSGSSGSAAITASAIVETEAGRYRIEIDPTIDRAALPMNADLRMVDGDLGQYAVQLCELDFANELAPRRCEIFVQPDRTGLLVGYAVLQQGDGTRIDTAVETDQGRSGLGCWVSGKPLDYSGGREAEIDIAKNFGARLPYVAWEKNPDDWMVGSDNDLAPPEAAGGTWFISRRDDKLRITQERWSYCYKNPNVHVDEVFNRAVTLTRVGG